MTVAAAVAAIHYYMKSENEVNILNDSGILNKIYKPPSTIQRRIKKKKMSIYACVYPSVG